MHGQQVNTPPTTVDDEVGYQRSQSDSPSWTSPRRRAPVPKAKIGKSPREKRRASQRDPTKHSRGGVNITGPLSEITKHMTDIPLKDMASYVTRSKEERLKGVRDKNGKVPRPMNSFMLYRSSYAPRIKELIGQTNHQEVSKAAGLGWKLESPEIREMYEEFARTERDNHAHTHPDYKFKPQKGPATTKSVGDLGSPGPMGLGMDASTPGSWDDPDFGLDGHLPMHSRSHSYDVDHMGHSSRTSTPFECIEPNSSFVSSWQPSYPGTTMPTVHPSALHSSMGGQVEDVHFRRTPVPQEMQYGMTSGLAGLPGGTHHDLLQPQSTHALPMRLHENPNLDPQMLSYDPVSSGLPGHMTDSYQSPSNNAFPTWTTENACYLPSNDHATSPSQYQAQVASAYLPNIQRNPSWEHQHEASEVSDADWVDVGTSNMWKVEE